MDSDKNKKKENINKNNNKKINLIDNDIHKLKEELVNLDPSKIIDQALNIDKKYTSESKLNHPIKNSELLEQIKNTAITNFVLDLDIKNKNKIKEEFIKEIDKFKDNAELAINRKEKISSEYISKYNQLLEENKLLKQKLNDCNMKYNNIEKELKNSQNQIIKMQMKSGLFEKNKKLFEEFLNYFPNEDPIDIMKGYEQRHLSSINVMNENEELKIKIKNITQQNMLDNEENLKHINKLYNKIDLLNKEKNKIIENCEIKVSKLNNQIKQIQSLEEKNKLLHKMLYQIYNKLIESFRLDKNLRLNDEYLNIKEEDFKPNIFDDIELGKYIKLMIATTKPYLCDKLLRETIAYSNMILRIYLKNKVNLRFDPLNTFKELKLIMEEKEDKIKKLSELVKKYESELNSQDNKYKKLSNIIKHIKKEKFNKINKKYLESARGSSSAININKKSDKKNNNLGTRLDETFNTKLFSEENKSIEEGKKLLKSYNSITDKNKDNNKFKINYNYKINQRPQTSFNRRNLIKRRKYKYHSPDRESNKIKYRLLSADIQNLNINEKNISNKEKNDLKFYKDPLYQSLYSMNKDTLIFGKSTSETNLYSYKNDNIKIIKKIEGVKNRHKNKILKEHGNQSLITYLNEFSKLINHTNRLFLYKTRISPRNHNSFTFNLNNKKRAFKIEKKSFDKKLKSKIIGKINGLITSLEMKPKAEKHEEKNEKTKKKIN